MLTKVEARTLSGTLLTLDLLDYSQGFIVEDIDGLDPVDATLVYSDLAGQDVSVFQSARRGNRDIVITLGFEPNYSTTQIVDLRRRLYKFFMPKTPIRLRFYEDDGLVVEIAGRVEKMPAKRFAKDPDAVITVVCEDSNFVDLTPLNFTGNTTPDSTVTPLSYAGSIETGILFTLYPNRSINGFAAYNTPEDNSQRSLQFTAPMVAGDVLKISTIPGNKFATLTHAGVDSSVMYGVNPAASWLQLFPGINNFRVLEAGAVIPWRIDFTTKYGGL